MATSSNSHPSQKPGKLLLPVTFSQWPSLGNHAFLTFLRLSFLVTLLFLNSDSCHLCLENCSLLGEPCIAVHCLECRPSMIWPLPTCPYHDIFSSPLTSSVFKACNLLLTLLLWKCLNTEDLNWHIRTHQSYLWYMSKTGSLRKHGLSLFCSNINSYLKYTLLSLFKVCSSWKREH